MQNKNEAQQWAYPISAPKCFENHPLLIKIVNTKHFKNSDSEPIEEMTPSLMRCVPDALSLCAKGNIVWIVLNILKHDSIIFAAQKPAATAQKRDTCCALARH